MARDGYKVITVRVRCGKVFCSRPIDIAWGAKGCSLGVLGGMCLAFGVQREAAEGNWKRLPQCLGSERGFKATGEVKL